VQIAAPHTLEIVAFWFFPIVLGSIALVAVFVLRWRTGWRERNPDSPITTVQAVLAGYKLAGSGLTGMPQGCSKERKRRRICSLVLRQGYCWEVTGQALLSLPFPTVPEFWEWRPEHSS